MSKILERSFSICRQQRRRDRTSRFSASSQSNIVALPLSVRVFGSVSFFLRLLVSRPNIFLYADLGISVRDAREEFDQTDVVSLLVWLVFLSNHRRKMREKGERTRRDAGNVRQIE